MHRIVRVGGAHTGATLLLVGTFACSGAAGDGGTDTSDNVPDTHGTVHIELNAADPSVFAGTQRITANLSYGADCLGTFYEANSNWAHDGVDGAPEFEEWVGRLCDKTEFDKLIDCEVQSIEQQTTASGLKLKVHYRVTSNDLYLKEIRVGPIPKEGMAGCYPTMRIDSGSVAGYDDIDPLLGGQVWHIESYDPDIVSVDEGAPAIITAAN